MKTLNRILCMALMAFVFVGPAFGGKVALKLGHVAESSHPYGQGADYFAKLVAEKSNGEIEVKVFPSAQLGSQKDLVESMIYGGVDLSLVGTAVLGQFQPQISILDLPFLFKDRKHTYRSLDTVGMKIGKSLQPKGIKLLGYMENGVRHLTNNTREIKTPSDMKDLKIRVMNNSVYIEMMKALGASPTPMAFGELYSAMQQGTVDGQENPGAHIWTKRFFEVQKYASLTAHTYAPEPLIASMVTWRRLSPKHRGVIEAAAKEAIVWQRKLSADMETEYWNKIKSTGKIKVSEVDRTLFKTATASVRVKFANKISQEHLDQIAALAGQ